jgi:hypothetical protein
MPPMDSCGNACGRACCDFLNFKKPEMLPFVLLREVSISGFFQFENHQLARELRISA